MYQLIQSIFLRTYWPTAILISFQLNVMILEKRTYMDKISIFP
jgi:hypothetical protein